MRREVQVYVAVAVDADVRVVVLGLGEGADSVDEGQRFGEVCEAFRGYADARSDP